jgi:hypothetical protein
VGKRSDSRSDAKAAAASPPPLGDIAFVWGKNADGVHILRRRGEDAPVEAGVLQPLVEGRPITGELVSMRPRDDLPFVYDVKSELPAPTPRSSGGPSQVATDSYRKGWDAIWGSSRKRRPSSDRNIN